ncbi:NrtR DNA-binding winged helix domain-containing protein [Flavobacterium faecale]|uniref:NrtR DNA-binding winged helix domain-containing protein n=1 Tax=Flavobacterium faecale TaxID=1355330 RepID=UPI003AADDB4F
MGFNHKKNINEAYADLKEKALYKPIVFELLFDKFTIKDLQDTFEVILGVGIDNRNFRRKLITKKYIIALDEKQVGLF